MIPPLQLSPAKKIASFSFSFAEASTCLRGSTKKALTIVDDVVTKMGVVLQKYPNPLGHNKGMIFQNCVF